MSGKYQVTAKLDTVVAVRYTNSGTSHGKWSTQPGGTAPVGTSQIFVATNNDSASAGPQGWASYAAADGTQFTFRYDDPNSTHNDCVSKMAKVSGNYTLPTPDYPSSGLCWTVTYKVATGPSFADVPVFADDVLAASKCEAYGEDRIRALLADRSCVHLADALGHAGLPVEGKVWCAAHPLFLTPASKGALTRDLALLVAGELHGSGALAGLPLDDALQASLEHSSGQASPSRLALLGERIDHRVRAGVGREPRETELLDCLRGLAHRDQSTGWSDAVSSYLGALRGAEYARRAERILALVAARL